jgi:hypothetical protein
MRRQFRYNGPAKKVKGGGSAIQLWTGRSNTLMKALKIDMEAVNTQLMIGLEVCGK